jgi:nucleoside-diphosphate-sugar epimerase
VDRFIELGHEVAVFDDLSTGFREFVNPRAEFHLGDLADASAIDRCVRTFEPEIVTHLAAQMDVRKSVTDPLFDARVNVLGSIGLLQACTKHGVRKVVYASTGGALYGEGRQLPATEDHPVNPESPYGASKHTVEHYLYLWKLLHGLDYTVLRYPNVYGPRQNPHGEAGVNAIFIGLMLEGKRPRIFGDRQCCARLPLCLGCGGRERDRPGAGERRDAEPRHRRRHFGERHHPRAPGPFSSSARRRSSSPHVRARSSASTSTPRVRDRCSTGPLR